MSKNNFPLHGCGVGLRAQHYPTILSSFPKMDWFEAITENYMDSGGRPVEVLKQIREHYPVALHGVALSIGSADDLDERYLKRLKVLVKTIDPFIVSDHLCWSGVDGKNLHDLLPLPHTEEAVDYVSARIGRVQDYLQRRILIENVSTYVTHKVSSMTEWEFLSAVAQKSGCGILLDLNNIYVNSKNHQFDPYQYINGIDKHFVGQFHLAGHTDMGSYLFDTHSASVIDAVWDLYRYALEKYGRVNTLIEWDDAIPDFSRLAEEAAKARKIYKQYPNLSSPRKRGSNSSLADSRFRENDKRKSITVAELSEACPSSLRQTQQWMKKRILPSEADVASREDENTLLNPQGGFPGVHRMLIYAGGYETRMQESLSEVYVAVKHLMGQDAFSQLSSLYARAYPSEDYNLNHAGKNLPEFIATTSWAKNLGFLPDLAQFEWLISRSFHEFEEKRDLSTLKSLVTEQADRLVLVLQPYVFSVTSPWPILDLWRARMLDLGKIDINLVNCSQSVLIYRKGLEVFCLGVDAAEARFVRCFKEGKNLDQACDIISEEFESTEDFPVAEWLSRWAELGCIQKVKLS